jgi:hypothetical protein
MTDATERPLVTFAVIAYNQERYMPKRATANIGAGRPKIDYRLSR